MSIFKSYGDVVFATTLGRWRLSVPQKQRVVFEGWHAKFNAFCRQWTVVRKKLVSEFYVAVPVKSDIGFNFRICQSITYPVPCTQQAVYYIFHLRKSISWRIISCQQWQQEMTGASGHSFGFNSAGSYKFSGIQKYKILGLTFRFYTLIIFQLVSSKTKRSCVNELQVWKKFQIVQAFKNWIFRNKYT